MDKLRSQIEGLTAKKTKHSENVKELTAEIGEINKTVKEATETRNEQKTENQATIADAVAAQDAVAKAIGILTDFYSKSSFLQQPELKSYGGMADSSVGVVGLLETIQSDFSLLESDVRAAEAEAAAAYKSLMADSKRQLGRKKQQVSDNKIAIIKTQVQRGSTPSWTRSVLIKTQVHQVQDQSSFRRRICAGELSFYFPPHPHVLT